MSAEARLKELGLVLPVLPKPVANYLPYRLAGNLLFLAGQGPRDEKGAALTGKLGAEISIDEGYRRARLVGLGLLAAMRDAFGSLDHVDIIVKLLGMVSCFDSQSLYVDDGGLMSYRADLVAAARRAAELADRIARGAKPSDLPVEQSTRFTLRINLKSAKALGITFPPPTLCMQAPR